MRSSLSGQSGGTSPNPEVMTKMPSFGSAKCRAYVILPRKYSADMNANASAIGTPSGERNLTAASNFARGDASCFARRPFTFAGERRKIFAGTRADYCTPSFCVKTAARHGGGAGRDGAGTMPSVFAGYHPVGLSCTRTMSSPVAITRRASRRRRSCRAVVRLRRRRNGGHRRGGKPGRADEQAARSRGGERRAGGEVYASGIKDMRRLFYQ